MRREERPGKPLQAQPFDEQPGGGQFQRRHPGFDGTPGYRIVAPARRDEPGVGRRAGGYREDLGHRGSEQRRRDTHSSLFVRSLIEIEHIKENRGAVLPPPPPGKPGHKAVTSQRQPHPLRSAAAAFEIIRQLAVEDVRQLAEEFEFRAPGYRAHGQVVSPALSPRPICQRIAPVLVVIMVARCGQDPPAQPRSWMACPWSARFR
ncbi:MAG: hypothetical protein ABSB01_21360 [Streptosporangiaceae bacterium]